MKNIICLLILCYLSPIALTAQVNNFESFQSEYNELLQAHVMNGKVNYDKLRHEPIFKELVAFVETARTSELSSMDLLAFRINAYNLTVLNSIVISYPIYSVQEVSGFFDQIEHTIENMPITLNKYEKLYLLRVFDDPRLHFVLNCGAISCPPILDEAYIGNKIQEQLTRQTTKALDDRIFLRVASQNKVGLSQIFNWYASDFGGSRKSIINFINQYRTMPVADDSAIEYYEYDWSLNNLERLAITSNSANRYVVSSTIPKGSVELKFFNNLYSEKIKADDRRSTFFTTLFSGLYGLNNRLNIGIAGRFRAVSNHTSESSAFDVFGFNNVTSSRIGLTAIGPIVRYAPVPKWQNFSIQSTLTFPIGRELGGSADKPYIDWNGAFFNTQLFNDFTLSSKFSLFTEVDLLIEDIGFNIEDSAYRFSTPATVILSYFPSRKTTIYALSGYSPYWQKPYDYFYQVGLGGKYQHTPDFELEFLYTGFRNKFLLSRDGTAETFNFGIRYNI